MRLDNRQVMIVDDDVITRKLLSQKLQSMACDVIEADSGMSALSQLEDDGLRPDIIVLDRIMDDIDGLLVLSRIKRHPELVNIPVIMFTSLESDDDIQRGIRAGAYQYLVKPVNVELFISSIHNALHESDYVQGLLNDLRASETSLGLMQESYFMYRTPEEAKNLALLLAACFPDPQMVLVGLMELTMNAVEHGNLNISYDEKRQLIKEQRLEAEIHNRLTDGIYADRYARIYFYRTDEYIKVVIRDEGKGFDWRKFMKNQELKSQTVSGRGIGLAKYVSFDEMQYKGKGNEVEALVFLSSVCTI